MAAVIDSIQSLLSGKKSEWFTPCHPVTGQSIQLTNNIISFRKKGWYTRRLYSNPLISISEAIKAETCICVSIENSVCGDQRY